MTVGKSPPQILFVISLCRAKSRRCLGHRSWPCWSHVCQRARDSAGVNVRVIDKQYGSCSMAVIVTSHCTLITPSPVKVAAGQADGIQPRTIEVLQVYHSPCLNHLSNPCNRAMDSPSA